VSKKRGPAERQKKKKGGLCFTIGGNVKNLINDHANKRRGTGKKRERQTKGKRKGEKGVVGLNPLAETTLKSSGKRGEIARLGKKF